MSSLQNNHSVLVCRWLCMHSFTLCYFFSQFLHTRYINLILLGFLLLWQAFPLSLLLPVLLLFLCSLSKCRAAPKPSCSPPAEYSVDREVAKIVLCSIISLWILFIFASPLSRWKTAFESELCYLIGFLLSKLCSLAKIQPAWVSFLDMMNPTEKHVANTPRGKSDNATSGWIYVDGSDCIMLDNWQRALVSFNLITTSFSLTSHLML